MARIVRTQIGNARPVYIGLRKAPTLPGEYTANEEGTGLILALVQRSENGRDWRVSVRPHVTMGEESQVMVPTLFAAAQIVGHARSRYLRWATAERERVLADRVVGL